MPISHATGQDFSSGSRLQSEGWFHLQVDDVRHPPTKHDGSLIDNGYLQIASTVAAGTVPGCENKQWELVLKYPDPAKPEFHQRRNDRTLIALGVIDPREPGKPVEFEPEDLLGRQFIAHIEASENNGKTYYNLAYADIFHVDDPEVASHPKNEAMLKLIPANLRRVGSIAAPGGKASPSKPAPAAPTQSNDFSSI